MLTLFIFYSKIILIITLTRSNGEKGVLQIMFEGFTISAQLWDIISLEKGIKINSKLNLSFKLMRIAHVHFRTWNQLIQVNVLHICIRYFSWSPTAIIILSPHCCQKCPPLETTPAKMAGQIYSCRGNICMSKCSAQ